MGFWLQLGVSGFRVDAVPFLIELKGPDTEEGLKDFTYLEDFRQFLSWLTSTELFPPELYFLSRLPADMDVKETTAVVVMALALSLLATLYPAWRAARLDPVEALRYE